MAGRGGAWPGGADGKYFKLFSLAIKLQLKPETKLKLMLELQPDRELCAMCNNCDQ